MRRDLVEMENGRYTTHPAFTQYMKALEKVPLDNDVTQAGSAYFEKFPSIFFETICSMFDKHIVSHWRNKKHLVYMIGGTPSLAKAFLRLLNATDVTENEGDSEHNHFVFGDG